VIAEQPFETTKPRTRQAKPLSHVIPRRRDGRGEAIPKRMVTMRPLVTLDPEALIETAAAWSRSPEEGLSRMPWLKAMNAIAASNNALALRAELEAKMERENAEAQSRLAALEPALKTAEEDLNRLESELALALAPFGLADVGERPSLDLCEDEPASLDEIAGRYNLPVPELKSSWVHRTGYKLLAGIGGGTVFGISLGLLTGKLELVSLAEEWPMLILWSILGVVVMTLVGASLFPLAKDLAGRLYCQGRRLPWLASLQAVFTVVFLVGLALAMVLIESKVEQLGLFKAIGEQTSLRGFHIAQSELAWVSMMLVIPTVCSYIVLGLHEGERLANLVHLKGIRRQLQEALRADPAYATACSLHCQVRHAQERRNEALAEVHQHKDRIRSELTIEEKQRLEDMEMDAASASWDAEDAMMVPTTTRTPVPRRERTTWWQRLIGSFNIRAGNMAASDAGAGDFRKA
jgi:hypothetical protein